MRSGTARALEREKWWIVTCKAGVLVLVFGGLDQDVEGSVMVGAVREMAPYADIVTVIYVADWRSLALLLRGGKAAILTSSSLDVADKNYSAV